MVGRYSAYRRGPDPVVSPDLIDRILIGACAAVWLVLVGVSVAAGVALADMGRGLHKVSSDSNTSWVLYTIIAISALVIAGSIPILIRARRETAPEPIVRSKSLIGRVESRTPVRTGGAGSRPLAESALRSPAKAYTEVTEWSGEAVDRIWLRGAVALTGVTGVALIAAATATYLMADGHDGAAWFSYGAAGVVTAGLPVVEWFYVRQIRRVREVH
ncbi:hypothetical protein BST27_26130 [Mycobacterium intermedium]|uniref:DUF2561 domain-containing protein n=1 Tax=Mycobacterium intermedium TaxID=28445 RepID=A0A1E3SCR2_MYCIE|nr:DUF2561 family protein [Mycobacterium intermedium]MCV6962386.1 DUF2561 family protein [Mycobacterium intermedium]ODQ99871.1 hypothetical protein BHQ20_15605 [Mycobacterium intermedium]OPE51853.1 hypothetical protein BV508_04620 [Mycobacterium intermedium]ORA95978.1 hypothetical protein BST27_26130 [Mycobacterium intermedium]